MKNIIITGASSGIGSAIKECLENENLILCARRELNLKNYFSYDLSDSKNCREFFSKAIEYFNFRIDVLINCAGQYIYNPIEKTTQDEIDYLIDLNFKSAYILSSLAIPYMKKNNWGRIINIGSISAMVGEANASLYSATKSALSGLTRALALETAQNNITVNQINPGWVNTPLCDILTSDEKQEVLDVTPQRRFIEPNEIAHLCKYLISDSAKGLTGQNINLCAGLSIGC
ncbi:MAG: SDR family oxidoreductase [Candidatus Gastranaerophilales bacterium]|nr:SDR family oxidoreductase [Candidatus Gastranaerophilales bacterium]